MCTYVGVRLNGACSIHLLLSVVVVGYFVAPFSWHLPYKCQGANVAACCRATAHAGAPFHTVRQNANAMLRCRLPLFRLFVGKLNVLLSGTTGFPFQNCAYVQIIYVRLYVCVLEFEYTAWL